MSEEGGPIGRALVAVIGFAREWLRRFVDMQGVDRGMGLGATAFTALLPLMIVYTALAPSDESFSDKLIDRFELTGVSASSLNEAFASDSTVESSVTGIGVLILIIAALSFTRALQRVYETAYGLAPLGMRGTPAGLQWLLAVAVFLSLRPVVLGWLDGLVYAIGVLAAAALLWLITPYMLLARRLSWKRLLPSSLLVAVGMTALGVSSFIWFPHSVASSADQFGLMGVAFALVSWLVLAGMVIVFCVAGGATVDNRLYPKGG